MLLTCSHKPISLEGGQWAIRSFARRREENYNKPDGDNGLKCGKKGYFIVNS
jgi:hypothetical protein